MTQQEPQGCQPEQATLRRSQSPDVLHITYTADCTRTGLLYMLVSVHTMTCSPCHVLSNNVMFVTHKTLPFHRIPRRSPAQR